MARIGKITETMISGMKYDREHGKSVPDICQKYGVSACTVSKYAPLYNHINLTEEQKAEIITLIDSGVSCKEIAEKYSIKISTIYNYLPSRRGRSHHTRKEVFDNNSPQSLPSEIISAVGGRMEELERDIKQLKDRLFELEKEHFSLEKWLNKNGVDTSVA